MTLLSGLIRHLNVVARICALGLASMVYNRILNENTHVNKDG